ncbi:MULTISPECIES: phage tail sheath family protein [Cyanophyceae]|uniref:Phage tail sheath subtilisin-like domain-containing protein n=1 Tax=Leptolyngbya subtilissima DQ-A4 TaxID=2933933 RepID=A0ABV0JZT0_9CYAN|nr:phage tail sheath subtilisin-like domain-containing protein [Nodosilinea sp. FACHB-141]MBD2112574.1 phage tail sheath family protein [Nodosilinea sp. FACHB-141]
MQTELPSLPGLYWQDVFPPKPVLPLTGVPAFLGVCLQKDGKSVYEVNQPQVFHLWTQFQEKFGPETPGSYIAAAVRGFFENGGRDCIVVWLDISKEALEKCLTADSVIDPADLLCAPDIKEALEKVKEALEKCLTADSVMDTADLICAPDITDQKIQAKILEHCAKMGDRFAILDTPYSSDLATLKANGEELKKRPDNDYGAIYGPWLKTPHREDAVPPCGHVAGVYAACDRANTPRAPANIALEGVLDVAALSREQQTQLAQLSETPINGIRSLRGRGVRIWGARTLSSDPQWRYVNVRRLAITIHRWIALNLADVAFETNDFRLWVRIERELNAYLQTLWQQGHLQGATPDEAFRVRCNGETNPLEMRDRGELITFIEFAPTIPNEFIQLRLIHGDTGVAIAAS